MESTGKKKCESSGKLPSLSAGRDLPIRWRDVRPGDTFMIRAGADTPEYSRATYTVLEVDCRGDGAVTVTVLLAGSGRVEEWMSGEGVEPFYDDIPLHRL